MDFLEYSDVFSEIKGAMCPGRLKLTDQHIIFKNSKTGKVEQLSSNDLEVVNWQRLIGTLGLRIFLKNGTLHRYTGFKEGEQEKIAKFFTSNYKKDMLEKELSLKGWNWGTAKFLGSVLSFDVGSNTAFEIPLNDVSQCTTGKNEVTLEFHQSDDTSVSLMEMRFHIPSSELAGDTDPVEAFHKQVMKQASVINLSGDAITTFKEIHCLTPRGRYDVKVYPTFFQLHGKTFDYKIPLSTVIRLFILPHRDGRQMFFVLSLDPPIKQGQTRYHFLVFLFGVDEETSVEVSLSNDELQEKYEGKLSKEMSGPIYEIMGKVMKAIIGRKITTPGGFVGHSQTPAVGCSYKAAAGFLYPLERGFIYVHKPPVHIRFEEITSVNFARGGGGTRSFDFEVETKSGVVHTFSSIEKDEYGKLFDFITSKKLRVKNRGKNDKPSDFDDFGNSDQEDEPDAYLARVKREAEERDEGDGQSEEESTDEDFNPDQQESDVAEEYDSSPPDTESDASGGSDGGKKEKKEKKPKKAKTVSEKPRKKRAKKERDEGKPKRPASSYFIWLNATREQIKADNPGISITEISKKAGELWKGLEDKSEWEAKAAKAKEEYVIAMKEYEASGGGSSKLEGSKEKKERKKKETTKKDSAKKESTGAKSSPMKSDAFKSKEYISDDDFSSSDDDGSSKKESPKKPANDKSKAKDSDEEKEADSSDDGSDDEDKKTKKKPVASKPAAEKKKTEAVKSKKKESDSDEDDAGSEKSGSESDAGDKKKSKKKPPAKVAAEKKKTEAVKRKKKESDSDEDDAGSEKSGSESDADDKKKSKKKPPAKIAKKDSEESKKKKKDESDDEIDEPIESTPSSSDAEDEGSGND